MGPHNLQATLETIVMEATSSGIFKTPNGTLVAWGPTVPTDAATGYGSGCLFFHADGSGANDVLYVNIGDETSANFDPVPGGLNTTVSTLSTTVTNLIAALNPGFIPIPLHSVRETSTMDVGDTTANGGLLASDTTPVLDAINAATDGCQRLLWASSNNDQVTFQTALPPDLDTTANMTVHFRIASGGTTDAVGFTLASYFNEGDTAVADTSGTNQTTTYAEVTATIAAADIPAGAQTLTVGLTPVAHTNDTLACTAIWIEYTRVLA